MQSSILYSADVRRLIGQVQRNEAAVKGESQDRLNRGDPSPPLVWFDMASLRLTVLLNVDAKHADGWTKSLRAMACAGKIELRHGHGLQPLDASHLDDPFAAVALADIEAMLPRTHQPITDLAVRAQPTANASTPLLAAEGNRLADLDLTEPLTTRMAGASDELVDHTRLRKRERQIRAILRAIHEKNWDPMSVPLDGKRALMAAVKNNAQGLFGHGDDPFNDAWKDASREKRLAIREKGRFVHKL